MTSTQVSLFAIALLSPALAQETLPPVEAILDRYIEVTGGRDAYANLKTEVRTVTVTLKGRDLSFTAVSYRAQPASMYTVTDIPGVGKVEEGVNGDVAWSLSAARGAAIKQGDERGFALYGARLDAEVNWREWFPKPEVLGTEDLDGRTCFKVLMRGKDGDSHTRYYDRESGFFVRMLVEVKLPQGKLPMDLRFSDYRQVGSLVLPHRTLRIMPGQEMESRVDKLEANIEIDPARFAVPEAVKALLEKS